MIVKSALFKKENDRKISLHKELISFKEERGSFVMSLTYRKKEIHDGLKKLIFFHLFYSLSGKTQF